MWELRLRSQIRYRLVCTTGEPAPKICHYEDQTGPGLALVLGDNLLHYIAVTAIDISNNQSNTTDKINAGHTDPDMSNRAHTKHHHHHHHQKVFRKESPGNPIVRRLGQRRSS